MDRERFKRLSNELAAAERAYEAYVPTKDRPIIEDEAEMEGHTEAYERLVAAQKAWDEYRREEPFLPLTHEAQVHIETRGQVQAQGHVEQIKKTYPEKAKHIYWLEPTDEDGSYSCVVEDAQGKIIAMTEQKTADDALLAIIEQLGPSSSDE